MTAFEVNFDGIVGPTHNYSGLSKGNVASENNAKWVSNPRQAALQGLEKMKVLITLYVNFTNQTTMFFKVTNNVGKFYN